MSRFYVPPDSVSNGKIIIRGDELHHAKDVMRLGAGDEIVVFDGTGKEYYGIIEKADRERMIASIEKTVERKTGSCGFTLVQAIPKSDKMDLIIEKATELGVEKIIPVLTARTVARPDTKGGSLKAGRWRKIALVAAKQCGRSTIPEVSDITRFEDSLKKIKGRELIVMPCLYDDTRRLKEVLSGKRPASAAVFIGPEGDFTKEEVEAAKAVGAIPVSLGAEVLRSETAAISVLSVINYELRW